MMKSQYINTGLSGLSEYQPGQRTLRNIGRPYMRGSDVDYVQRMVGVKADGLFGPQTQAAVQNFQATHGVPATGVVDAATWDALKSNQSIFDMIHFPDWALYPFSGDDKLPKPKPAESSFFRENWVWLLGGGAAAAVVFGAALSGGDKK